MTWERTRKHPPEYRATINGATCILRPARGPSGIMGFQAVIDRDTKPIDETWHPEYWTAKGYVEANA